MQHLARRAKDGGMALLALAAASLAMPAAAQIQSVDPDTAYEVDGDLAGEETAAPTYEDRVLDLPPEEAADGPAYDVPQQYEDAGATADTLPEAGAYPAEQAAQTAEPSQTYQEDDLLGAAEGVFGQGAEGLAGLIEDLLRDQGEPNGYIVGREGGGAFIFGVRYGSGTLYHKVEGQKPVYWTGPSLGPDVGANAGSTFILVYNLYDTEDLYERFPAGEGQLYALGGFNASYVRKGDIVLIPIRVGGGLRVGLNAGYLKFSKKQRWLPF
nr:DUF1134 domain-containing protein [Paraurantiacibacter namhicola]